MKSERFEMRLDLETLENLDSWRADQPDLPSRAEAVRRLIDAGLAESQKRTVRISDGEKMILMMLSDRYKHQKVDSDIDPKFVSKAISSGHYWGLNWAYGLHGEVDDLGVVDEVVDVLEMWWLIESGYAKLSQKDKQRVELEAEPFGANVKFGGFDGNNESQHLAIAKFLINDLERFVDFKDRYLNSHFPSLGAHRRMLAVFKPMWANILSGAATSFSGGGLSASQIIELLNAKTHPDFQEN